MRQLAAKVKLSRRLNRLIPLAPHSAVAIDSDYLKCAEYQLFLDEMQQQGKYYQPDHWTEYQFPAGQADQPVRGVRAEDATAFCDWLTQRQGGGVRFRLPRPGEANQRPLKIKELGAWCNDEGGYTLTPLSNKFEQDLREKLTSNSTLKLPSTLSVLLLYPSHALASARDLALDLSFALASARVLARDLAFALDLAFDLASARDLDLARDWASTRDLARDLDRVRDLDRDLDRARVLALDLPLALDLALALPLARVLARVRDLALDLARARKFLSSYRTVSSFLYHSELCLFRANMLSSLLEGIIADDKAKVRHAFRKNLAEFLKAVYTIYPETEKPRSRLKWLRSSRRRTEEVRVKERKQRVLEAYWWLEIIMAREEGKLPAWEGIQIVREQVQSE